MKKQRSVMPISREEVKHIASSARLKLSDEEITLYSGQLSDIITYVDKLKELNVDDVKTMSHVLDMVNVMREDKGLPSLSREEVMKNAPSQDGENFKVPRVIK
ncbi:MAG: Asp-tRNA(Asn)/Glu-tRNA(Gln) amidotransferase subunit GatC [Candidatus Marinimicrobia bacterium]|nr:Asp-tRNA(Asn)/Glu-tRNA(Gln) amidotransferase subunit GatC [Candidatus Neomarinimicrobiota bacterium]